MKLIFLAILTMICAGCGDTINNTAAAPPAGTTPLFRNTTSHPASLAGSTAYIPSDTFCTPKMNEIFAVEGKPDTIDISDSLGAHSRTWNYATPILRTTYSFGWNDVGYVQYAEPIACSFNFYKTSTITP